MIATWMVYAMAIGALFGVAALVAARAAGALRSPVRIVWAIACLLTLLAPACAYVMAIRRPLAIAEMPSPMFDASVPMVARSTETSRPTGVAAMAARLRPMLQSAAQELERPLLLAWVVASLLLLGRLGVSIARLRSRRRTWLPSSIDGTTVLISQDVGPAVVGLHAMHIVMPEWSLALDPPLRAVVLRHESEHRRVGDPYVLFGAALACALVPWNLVLWWQTRRLRLAVEIDCDARVLRDHPHVDRYGTLLLAIAQRSTSRVPVAAAALTESPSDLERRIDAMTRPPRRSRLVAACTGILAAITIAVACETPIPAARAASGLVDPAPAIPTASTAPTDAKTKMFDVASSPRTSVAVHDPLYTRDEVDRPATLIVSSTPPAADGAQPSLVLDSTSVGTDANQSYDLDLQIDTSTPHATGDSKQAADTGDDRVYFEFQVEQQATFAPGNSAPRYPAALRAGNIEGSVLVSFVVDEDGRADTTTFRVIKTTHHLFTDAVRDHLPDMRFVPAMLHGHAVKQLVQMPFRFTLDP